MSLGDRLRGMLDPLDPAVRAWLQKELPRLVRDSYLSAAQADLIARRYGVRVTDADIAAAASEPAASSEDTAEAAAPDTLPAPGMPGLAPAETWGPRPSADTAPTAPAAAATGASIASAAGSPQISTPGAAPTGGAPQPPVPAGQSVGAVAPVADGPRSTPFVADHAVSIVLYLGAFLVVASVIIFLAYSWEQITGGMRLAALMALTGGFLGAAAVCLPRPAVRPAGRTFLALGAILVPANVAAVYLVYFWDSPIPAAMFWLLGALISGVLHAALSVRLRSTGYAILAVPSAPVAACALGWLIDPHWEWLGASAAISLALLVTAARYGPPIPLVLTARVLGSALLVLAALVSLPAIDARNERQWSTAAALIAMSAALAFEAARRGKTWWFGAAAALATGPFVALALSVEVRHVPLVVAAIVGGWLSAAAARWLQRQQRLVWAIATLAPATIYPLAAWEVDRSSLALFASLIGLVGVFAWAYRSVLPLYVGVLAVDGLYVKLLDIYGSPDSPGWMLGVALWPLALLWLAAGAMLPRRQAGPAWVGALVTMTAAQLIAWPEARWALAIAASGLVGSILGAWRLRFAPVLLLASLWLVAASLHLGDLLAWEWPWRAVLIGVSGWILFAVSTVRLPGFPVSRTEPEAPSTPGPTPDPSSNPAAATPATAPQRVPRPPLPTAALSAVGASTLSEWAMFARLAALVVAGLGIVILMSWAAWPRTARDLWLIASTVSWLNVAVLLGTWAFLARAWLPAWAAALAVVPALLSGIGRLHPEDAQLYAAPVGLYLLAAGLVGRRQRQGVVANVLAGAGLVALLGTSVVQSFDRDGFGYALLALVEGLGAVGAGIALRWRVIVVVGVAGTVVIALRQLFDAVSALPGWAILGGSGILLLTIAVVLLLVRARLAAAGRAAAERWTQWD